MLSANVTSLTTDNHNFLVAYNVGAANQAATDLGIYRSTDGATWESTPVQIAAAVDLSQGSHVQSVVPSFTDSQADYFLKAAVVGQQNASSDGLLNGGIFQSTDGVLHVQGSSGADTVSIAADPNDSLSINVTLNSGAPAAYFIYSLNEIHVRTHSGNDAVSLSDVADPTVVFANGGSLALADSGSIVSIQQASTLASLALDSTSDVTIDGNQTVTTRAMSISGTARLTVGDGSSLTVGGTGSSFSMAASADLMKYGAGTMSIDAPQIQRSGCGHGGTRGDHERRFPGGSQSGRQFQQPGSLWGQSEPGRVEHRFRRHG